MENKGIYVDKSFLQALSIEINQQLEGIEKEIHALAGKVFNLNSPKQLSEILFNKLGITPPKKTATGHSTNSDVLEFLQHDYPIASKIIEYRGLKNCGPPI